MPMKKDTKFLLLAIVGLVVLGVLLSVIQIKRAENAQKRDVQTVFGTSDKGRVKVYFPNDKAKDNTSCELVFYAEREIPKTEAVAKAAVEELLKGPSDLERQAGFSTTISPGVTLQSIVIKNGVAKVDFNEALQFGVAGSCRVTAIRAQITQTLKQFSTVKDVVISINGKTKDILQP